MIPFFFQGLVLGISAALSPGPFQSLVIAESLVGGWRRAAPITFAPLLVDIPIALVLVFALSQVPNEFLNIVRLLGGLLLLILAWRLWGQIQQVESQSSEENPRSSRGGFFWGVVMLFLSPGPYLFWSLILGPLLMDALQLSIWHAILFLGAFYSFSIGGLLMISYGLSRLGGLSARALRSMRFASLILMLGIAIYLFGQVQV